MTDSTLTIFEKELSEVKQKTAPLVWSSPQGNLGSALLDLQASNADKLKELIKGFKDALEGMSQEESPQDWAEIQGKLANALHALGQQDKENSIAVLDDSMEAYKKELMVCKRNEEPLVWASILNNIGMIFQLQGEQSNGAHTLMKSLSAYNNVLTVRSALETPEDWAITQNNIGATLYLLAGIKQDNEGLDEALGVYEEAIKMIKPEQNPLGWLITMSNFYSVQRTKAKQTQNIDLAKNSVDNAESVVKFLADTSNVDYLKLARKEKEKSEEVLENITGVN